MKVLKTPTLKTECFSGIQTLEGSFIKAVVDIEKKMIAFDAGMHVDLEQYLLEQGSRQEDPWGINFYPEAAAAELIEFDSMINICPRQGNRSRSVDDPQIRQKIQEIAAALLI